MGETKQRSFRLSSELLDELNRVATARTISTSALAELLLAKALQDETQESPAPTRRAADSHTSETMLQELRSLQHQVKTLGELVSFFVFQWLCNTPAQPEDRRAALVSDAVVRHKRFLQILAGKLAKGEFSLQEFLSVPSTEPVDKLADTCSEGEPITELRHVHDQNH